MDYFYKISTDYNETDYKKEMIKFCLWENLTVNNTTTTSINYIRWRCGYSAINRNKNSFTDFTRATLKELINCEKIAQIYGDDIQTVTGTNYLEFKILDDFYNVSTKTFAKLTTPVFDKLMAIKCPLSKAALLKIYTYMREEMIESQEQAYGFKLGLDNTIVKDLSLNRKSIDTALEAFVNNGIFIKHTTGGYFTQEGYKNAPNIYVLPDKNADKNINALLDELKERYKVDEFAPVFAPSSQKVSNNIFTKTT